MTRSALDVAFDYAHERVAFGKPIVEHQAIQFKLAQMALKVDTARLLTWRSAWAADSGAPTAKLAVYAKLFAADTCMEVTTESVQILGGPGIPVTLPRRR